MKTIEIKTNLSGEELQVLMWELEAFCEGKCLSKPVLRQADVIERSEQFVCGANRVMGEKRCERQCGQCEELYPQTNCH